MAETNLATDAQLAEFDARNTDFGLLRRYAMRRLRQLPSRLFMVAFGALLTGVMISPALGIVTLSLAVLGDCIDCLMLTQILRRGQDEGGDKVFRSLTSVSAGLQALSICACFGLTYSARPEPDVAFFVLGFLCGSAISDGMLIAYHRQATLVRLAAYCSTLLIFFGLRVYLDGALAQEHVFGLAGTVVLGYVVWSYVASLGRARMRSLAISRDLLLRQRELERVGADLNSSLEENRRLALVARHANDGVFISQVDGPILWVNDAFTQITGYSLAEAKGRRVSDLLNGPDTNPQTVARIQRAISEKRACRTEIQSYTKDGSSVWIDTNIVPLIEEDGSAQVVIAIERNITATRRQMQELAVATQEANDRAKVRSDFLATMSHEIRTPLNGMMGMAEMLTRSDLSPQDKENAQAIHDSARALLKIIEDVLDLSRMEEKPLPIASDPFSVAESVKSAVHLLRPIAQDKGLTLDLTFDGPTGAQVEGDEGRLRQILLNLIGNALKFTNEGGVTVTATAFRKSDVFDVEISVSDTGIGVNPDQIAQIFEQYGQASDDIHKEFGGTGLGLTISRELARKMGGDLFLRDKPAPGSEFVLTLAFPLANRADSGPTEDDAVTQSEEAVTLPKGLRILVADDNATNRMVLDRFLDGSDADVLFASDGLAAVSRVQDSRPDVVLMDMRMPELDGPEATRRIRAADGPQPWIIAVTGGTSGAERDLCRSAGMNGFLSKPVRRNELFQLLADLVSSENPRGPESGHRVSGTSKEREGTSWTLQPESGTTSGKSTRSSGR